MAEISSGTGFFIFGAGTMFAAGALSLLGPDLNIHDGYYTLTILLALLVVPPVAFLVGLGLALFSKPRDALAAWLNGLSLVAIAVWVAVDWTWS